MELQSLLEHEDEGGEDEEADDDAAAADAEAGKARRVVISEKTTPGAPATVSMSV